ncbi:MAG: hypothetical protein NTV06_04980, partial [candidate division Zixibacteria bacterium]|nr:hypothetical protein [candidate division Zixibacteria bacterium]
MNKPLIIISLLAVLLPFSSCALEILPGQTLNYSDFSYISSVAVGYEYVYFGTTRGVIRYDISNRRWGEPMTGLRGLLGKQIEELKVSTDDEHIWAKTDQGVFEYTDLFRDWNSVGTMPDEPTNGRHLQPAPVYFPPIGFNYMPDGTLVDNNGRRFPLTDIVDDGWSNLWIGTWGLGALHADNTNLRMEPLQYGLLQEDISTICLDNGILWMGGQADNSLRTGITLFDWRRNIFDYIETEAGFTLKTDNINDISVDPANIFVATDNGVWAIDKGNRTINNKLFRNSGLPDNKVLAVLTSGDTLFVGSEFGLGLLSISLDSAAFSPNYFL